MKRILFILFLSAFGSAQGATVTLNGSSIKYEYDDVVNAAALALFGTPTIQGDVVRFLPPSFRAESIDGIGTITGTNTDLISGNFIFDRIYSTNQKALTQIQIVSRRHIGAARGTEIRYARVLELELANG